jgi:hypothetical protein
MTAGSDLLTATEVGVVRRPGPLWQEPTWDLLTPAGGLMASVVRQPGGSLKPGEHLRYLVADPAGATVWSMDRSASGQVSRFVVDHAGLLLGEVLQENVLFAPQFRMVAPDGATIRLANAKAGSYEWTVQDLAAQPLGWVTRRRSKDPAALEMRAYRVERGDGLGGELWPLTLLSAVCLDIVHDRTRH